MDPITGFAAAQAIQGVSNAATALLTDSAEGSGDVKATPKTPPTGDDFLSRLKGMLNPSQANSINEEELFAAIIQERLSSLKGDEAGAKFQEAFEAEKKGLTRGDGYVNVEQAAENALSAMIEGGVVTAEEGAQIRQESFRAAQLDDDHSNLYDSRGETSATAGIEVALEQAKVALEKIANGEIDLSDIAEDAGDTSVDASIAGGSVSPQGEHMDGAKEGFLFKPEADNSGKLVVLLPNKFARQVESVLLKDKNGKTIEEGSSSGFANGDRFGEREHFRFDRSGGDYPKNVEVVVKLKNGKQKTYKIPDPSKRYD